MKCRYWLGIFVSESDGEQATNPQGFRVVGEQVQEKWVGEGDVSNVGLLTKKADTWAIFGGHEGAVPWNAQAISA